MILFRKYILNAEVGYLIVGEDFKFGIDRTGDISTLKDLCAKHNIVLDIAEDVLYRENKISQKELRIQRLVQTFKKIKFGISLKQIEEISELYITHLSSFTYLFDGTLDFINRLKNKYRLIRDQKIRERVEALGVKTDEADDRSVLLQKEREYNLARQKIEFALESFYRSANSLVFQLNKRYITRHMSIFRCIDKRFETGEIFICLLYTSPSPRDRQKSRMPSSA